MNVSKVISHAYVGYFPLMAACPIGKAQPARITDGMRITFASLKAALKPLTANGYHCLHDFQNALLFCFPLHQIIAMRRILVIN